MSTGRLATVNTNVGGLTKTYALKVGEHVILLDVLVQDGTTITT